MANIVVANAAQFEAALSRAVGGDRILLRPGDYGSVRISGRNYASDVTIQSVHFNNQAHFDQLTVSGSSNIKFNLLDLGRERIASDSEFGHINMVGNSRNIQFNQIKFHGDLAGTPTNDLLGISIYDSTSVKITNSDFNDLFRGVYSLRSNDVQIIANDFHHIRSDGVVVASTVGSVIHNNLFRDFMPVGDDHADAIQYWNSGQSRGSSNASIKNNVIWLPEDYPGANQGVQGIWIAAPEEFGFRDFLIQNNMVYTNDRWNGIAVYGGDRVQILENTVMSRSGDGELAWIRVENSNDVLLRSNVSEDQLIRNSDVTRIGNINLAQTPALRALFENATDPQGIYDLILHGIGFRPRGTMLRTVPLGQELDARSVVELDYDPIADDTTLLPWDDDSSAALFGGAISAMLPDSDASGAIDLSLFEPKNLIAKIDSDFGAFRSLGDNVPGDAKAVATLANAQLLQSEVYAEPAFAQWAIADHFVAMA